MIETHITVIQPSPTPLTGLGAAPLPLGPGGAGTAMVLSLVNTGMLGDKGDKGDVGDVNPLMPVILGEAQAARDAALLSQGAAAAAAVGASGSATNAATSATTATTQATQAAGSATSAATSATSGATSATAAATSATNAATSATTATTKATEAAAAAAAALGSATNAAGSAAQALDQANNATAAAAVAEDRLLLAAAKAAEAAASASAASASATSADASAGVATLQAGEAASAALNAATSDTGAAASAALATTQAGAAGASATAAAASETNAAASAAVALTEANNAQSAAVLAEDRLTLASAQALQASASATAASASATNADTSATSATASATAAQTSATAAAVSADAADGSRLAAAGFADQAAGAADTAGLSATAALNSANAAAASATAAQDSDALATTQAAAAGVSADAAAASQAVAGQWAESPEDTPVQPGLYSAKHWAVKAESAAQAASGELIDDATTTTLKTWSSDKITAELQAVDVSAAVNEHIAAPDPHPQYATDAEVGAQFAALGSAATADVTTSNTDATAGRVLKVGDFGVGATSLENLALDFDTPGVVPSGLYSTSPTATAFTPPEGIPVQGVLLVISRVDASGLEQVMQQWYPVQVGYNGRAYLRTATTGTWSAWEQITTQTALDEKLDKTGGTSTGRQIVDAATGAIALIGGAGQVECRNAAGASSAAAITFHRGGVHAVNFGLDTDNKLKIGGWSLGANAYKVWHEGQQGAGSGLDADLLDGMQPAAGVALNTIAQRDGSGDLHVRLLRSTFAEQTVVPAATADLAFRTDAATDNYTRFMSRDAFFGYQVVGLITATGASKTLLNQERCTVTVAGQTITLPAAPVAGFEVSISVGAFTNTTVARNGQTIMGLAENMTIDAANMTVTLLFVDATRGWRIV